MLCVGIKLFADQSVFYEILGMKLLHHQIYHQSEAHPWVVFLHGAGGSMETWKYQQQAFQPHFNLLLLDLRDHGQSKEIQPVYERYTFDMISEDIMAVMRKAGIQKAFFMTLSFGSVLLQDLSIRYPGLIKKAVIAGGIFKGNFMIKAYVHLARIFNLFLSYPQMYRLFSYLLMPKENHQLSRRVYQRQARKLSSQAYLKWIGLYAQFFKLLNRFCHHPLNFETLVVMGADDYVFLKAARVFVSQQPHAQLQVMPDAGHICSIDQPEIFNRFALQFLREIQPSPHYNPSIT
jgi:pimeloyl-ACP methyl ester carboxylesterase